MPDRYDDDDLTLTL